MVRICLSQKKQFESIINFRVIILTVTLCSSYRRWSDVTEARDLHASTATTFSTFLASLKTYETARSSRDTSAALVQTQVFEDLHSLSARLSQLSLIILERDQESRQEGAEAVKLALAKTSMNLEVVMMSHTKKGVEDIVIDVRSALERLSHEVRQSIESAVVQVSL